MTKGSFLSHSFARGGLTEKAYNVRALFFILYSPYLKMLVSASLNHAYLSGVGIKLYIKKTE